MLGMESEWANRRRQRLQLGDVDASPCSWSIWCHVDFHWSFILLPGRNSQVLDKLLGQLGDGTQTEGVPLLVGYRCFDTAHFHPVSSPNGN